MPQLIRSLLHVSMQTSVPRKMRSQNKQAELVPREHKRCKLSHKLSQMAKPVLRSTPRGLLPHIHHF